ncbi:MAG: UPF0104 family protein, partial [Xanthobacteraceae bacterium]
EFGKEHMLASLLLFRILYFVFPFTISVSIMGSRELWLNVVKPWNERRKSGALNSIAGPQRVKQPHPAE